MRGDSPLSDSGLCPGVARRGSLRRLFAFGSCGEQFQQHGVALVLELVDGAAVGFFQNPFEKRLLNLGAEFGDFPEIFPPCR